MSDLLENLSRPFPVEEVKQRAGGRGKKLDYVGIDSVIRRLNETTGMMWGLEVQNSSLERLVKIEKRYQVVNPQEDNRTEAWMENVYTYSAAVQVLLTVRDDDNGVTSARGGVGADTDTDPDKAYKTALAEAIKKAGNQFGIALELWDADHRDNLAQQRNLATADLDTLKGMVAQRAIEQGVEPSTDPAAFRKALAKHFGVTVLDLNNTVRLREILS